MENRVEKTIEGKNYLERFLKLPIYSFLNNGKVQISPDPKELFELFDNNTSYQKKSINPDEKPMLDDKITIDNTVVIYYLILALKDLYKNHVEKIEVRDVLPDIKLSELEKRIDLINAGCQELKKQIDSLEKEKDALVGLLSQQKKKNDNRFEFVMNHLETHKKRLDEFEDA
jgi:hypothetical protein